MKIGLLNPWEQAAENQLIPLIQSVASTLGHTAVECKTSQDILDAEPDFVLSMSRTQAKLTNVPTYGLLFDPRDILLQKASYLDNLLSYDGVFTMFDRLHEFATDVGHAARRPLPIGAFYPTCKRMTWETPIDFSEARLAYFGTNWDRRRQDVFEALDGEPWMQIFGPRHGWAFLNGPSYQGPVPFDGTSVIERYRQAGAGLCLFSDSHVADDIISSRVFEVCAAGAVVIAPRMSWLERHFGDAVLYLDQHLPDDLLAEQIRQHMRWIRANPEAARVLAERSAHIFAERFSLDVLLPRVFDFHRARVSATPAPVTSSVTAIVVCADATEQALARTLASIQAQRAPVVDVIVTVPSEADAERLTDVLHAHRALLRRCQIHIASRSTLSTLIWEGLHASVTELVAVLHAGDVWLDGHLTAVRDAFLAHPSASMVISGSIQRLVSPYRSEGGNLEHRRLRPFALFPQASNPVMSALDQPIGAVTFRRDALDRWMLADPDLAYAADAYLLLALLMTAPPAQTYRVTTLQYDADDPIHRTLTLREQDDLARIHVRYLGQVFPSAAPAITLEHVQASVQRVEPRPEDQRVRTARHGGAVEYLLPPAFAYAAGPESTWEPRDVPIDLTELVLAGDSKPLQPDTVLPLLVEPPARPWAYGLRWSPTLPDERPHVVRLTCRIETGSVAFGVLTAMQRQFDHRVLAPPGNERVIVSLPVARPADFGGIVVQTTQSGAPARLTIEHLQIFATSTRLPLDETQRVVDENLVLREQLAEQATERSALLRELEERRRRVREMRGSRLWRLGQVYWRLRQRLGLGRQHLGRRPEPADHGATPQRPARRSARRGSDAD